MQGNAKILSNINTVCCLSLGYVQFLAVFSTLFFLKTFLEQSLLSKNLISFQYFFFILICQLRVFLISLYFLGWEGGRKLLSLSLTSSSFYKVYKSQFLFHSDFSEEVEFSMQNLENQGSSMQIWQLEKKWPRHVQKCFWNVSDWMSNFEIFRNLIGLCFYSIVIFSLQSSNFSKRTKVFLHFPDWECSILFEIGIQYSLYRILFKNWIVQGHFYC